MLVRLNGERVRKLREDAWLSRRELAMRAGISENTLRNVECEDNDVGVMPKTARAIGSALDVDPKSLAYPKKPPVKLGGERPQRSSLDDFTMSA